MAGIAGYYRWCGQHLIGEDFHLLNIIPLAGHTENHITNSVITEKAKDKIMYDVRKISEYIKEVGRALTKEEIRRFSP